MPAAKYKRKGKTVQCPRTSVLLPPPVHRLAKAKAKKLKVSFSDYAGDLIAKDVGWGGDAASS
jgi:hypothetical protein